MTDTLNCRIEVPEKAARVLSVLQEHGYEAYVVGGCVRDSILGRDPHDWDITTSAKPEQVKELFPHTIDTGLQHGTVTVMIDREGFEVTTYRIDGEYVDGRHPAEVIFTPELKEDLRRRDFTINAMAYNDTEGLVDIFGGMEDIQKKRIRCVGSAMERFGEDALRILRAIRFSAQLGYDIDPETREGIRALAGNLSKISAERIREELVKLLVSPHPDYLRMAWEDGITRIVLPEFDKCMETEQVNPHHCYSVGEHILVSLQHAPAKKEVRLAMLFHDIGKPEALTVDENGVSHFYRHPEIGEKMAVTIMNRLRFDNDTIAGVRRLVKYHDYGNESRPDMRTVRRAVSKIGNEAFPDLFDVKYADFMAQSTYQREEKLERLGLWRELYQQIEEQGQCTSLKMLQINGSDLIRMGIQPGKQIGEILGQLLEEVIEEPERNQKEYLTERVRKILGES